MCAYWCALISQRQALFPREPRIKSTKDSRQSRRRVEDTDSRREQPFLGVVQETEEERQGREEQQTNEGMSAVTLATSGLVMPSPQYREKDTGTETETVTQVGLEEKKDGQRESLASLPPPPPPSPPSTPLPVPSHTVANKPYYTPSSRAKGKDQGQQRIEAGSVLELKKQGQGSRQGEAEKREEVAEDKEEEQRAYMATLSWQEFYPLVHFLCLTYELEPLTTAIATPSIIKRLHVRKGRFSQAKRKVKSWLIYEVWWGSTPFGVVNTFVDLLTLANTSVIVWDIGSEYEVSPYRAFHQSCLVVYTLEAMLKFWALGRSRYFSRFGDKVDFAVTILGWASEIAQVFLSQGNSLEYIQTVRLIRLFRLLGGNPYFFYVFRVLRRVWSTAVAPYLVVLYLLFEFFAFIGIAWFGGVATPETISPDNSYASAGFWTMNFDWYPPFSVAFL